MTKELYDRLLKYREPHKLEAGELSLSSSGYIRMLSNTIPPLYVLTDRAGMEMSDFEKAEDRRREIEQRDNEIRRKQDHQNRVIIWLAALTLAATVIFGVISVLLQALGA